MTTQADPDPFLFAVEYPCIYVGDILCRHCRRKAEGCDMAAGRELKEAVFARGYRLGYKRAQDALPFPDYPLWASNDKQWVHIVEPRQTLGGGWVLCRNATGAEWFIPEADLGSKPPDVKA